ncbi:MAG: dethiobiotin synthase [Bacteroidota bacterium]|nr:dethiobiotin synthase [Bacteroidota bacterium]
MQPIFITGIGTGIGKTVVSAVVVEALKANYWKPVQAGFDDGTDAATVKDLVSNKDTIVYPEVYRLKLPASPHIAAGEEGIKIDLEAIYQSYFQRTNNNNQFTIIEGAGGLLVPLTETEFMIDLIKKLRAKVILVSRNYLGSINHSLLTASVCKANNLNVLGWMFNDVYLNYENEIAAWSGYPKIASLPLAQNINKAFVKQQATEVRVRLLKHLR